MVIVKRIQSSFITVLKAKIYFFLRKSLWMYLIGMIILGNAFPLASFGTILSALIYFLIFLIIVLVPVYYFSSIAIANKCKLDADLEFNDKEIVIKHRNKSFLEVKEWNWVRELHVTKHAVYFIVNYPHRFLISFSKHELSESEIQFFVKKTSLKPSV